MTAKRPIRVLIVEDNQDDADLLLLELRRGPMPVQAQVAADLASARTAFAAKRWDAVLSDYNLPGTRFTDILALAKMADADLPVIVVSGFVGEETAVSLIREGASDLILKSNLSRVTAVLSRELKSAEDAYARRESERRFRDIVLATADWVWETDEQHRLCFEMAGREQAEWSDPLRSLGRTHWEAVGADPEGEPNWKEHRRVLEAHEPFRDFRFCFSSPGGQEYHVSLSGRPAFNRSGSFVGYRGTATDETLVVDYYRQAETADAALAAVLDLMNEPLLLFDADDRLLLANAAWRAHAPARAANLPAGTPLRQFGSGRARWMLGHGLTLVQYDGAQASARMGAPQLRSAMGVAKLPH